MDINTFISTHKHTCVNIASDSKGLRRGKWSQRHRIYRDVLLNVRGFSWQDFSSQTTCFGLGILFFRCAWEVQCWQNKKARLSRAFVFSSISLDSFQIFCETRDDNNTYKTNKSTFISHVVEMGRKKEGKQENADSECTNFIAILKQMKKDK